MDTESQYNFPLSGSELSLIIQALVQQYRVNPNPQVQQLAEKISREKRELDELIYD